MPVTPVIDYGPPLPLRKGKGGALKIKRGGTGKVSNSGNAAGRFHAPVRALRDPKTGRHLPQPPRGKPIWDPTDPFIVEYRREHPPIISREERDRLTMVVDFEVCDKDGKPGVAVLQSGPSQGPWFDSDAKTKPHPQLQEMRDRIEAEVEASGVKAIDDQMKGTADGDLGS